MRHRIDQAYMDKLDGKISEDFWTRKSTEWLAEEQQISLAMKGFEDVKPITVGMSSANRVLIVANTDRDENIRIISARKTTQRERKHYEETN